MTRPVVLPTNDVAFKKLFADPNNSDLLISFLNAILNDFIDFKIEEVSLQDPVQLPERQDKKTTILDVYCKDSAKFWPKNRFCGRNTFPKWSCNE